MALARRQHDGEVGAFLTHEGVFGELGGNSRFVAAFTEELTALRQQGARARMRALTAQSH